MSLPQSQIGEIIPFDVKGDYQGRLVALEELRDVPFDIKRIYYIYNTLEDVIRGRHGHLALTQLLICLRGSCDVVLDDGRRKERVRMDKPSYGLLIKPMTWREMHHITHDCVLMVLADAYYDEADYIRDYDDFIRTIREQKDGA